MKKLFILIAALCVSLSARAQFGVVAGVTSTETDIKEAVKSIGDVTQYHIGMTYRFNLGLLAIQPSLIYNVKGTKVSDAVSGNFDGKTPAEMTQEFKTGFLELPVQIQVGIPLSVVRPYVFAEPFVGYAITNDSKYDIALTDGSDSQVDIKKSWDNVKNRLEYGVGVGAGIDLFDTFQVSVRYFWNLGELYNDGQSSLTDETLQNVVTTVKEQKCNGIMASVAFFF